jgi:uncharacterized protein YdcH (DUF465 family)
MTTRLFHLLEQHQRIDRELRLESSRRWPDIFRVMRLKKMKLRIKDRLGSILPKRELAR